MTAQPRHWWEHRVPPPVIDGACALLMWWLAHALPTAQLWPRGGPVWALALALLLAVLGGGVALAGLVAFRRARTTFNPMAPQRASALVTGGIYRVTRNPMYLGMLLVLAGWGVWLGNAASWLALPLSVALLTALQIRPEERILRARFGAAFDAYAAHVRRWI
ncbi:MAG TPA: isoprenylcysteine carboxylmethyltransferase family protein [Ottowia sp.]|uniref:methyltransferase family protein n=1 Tax=Ottowia sp. TaxID=1898956 RepID=UPI002CE4C38D|nr:isoprenylcysteine carboxylmethyltransferase family protein [Ottowia sp.]HMN20877.1 isoprenylcysteine carboxylmethyltransferase family protein [Ottowia sp.]